MTAPRLRLDSRILRCRVCGDTVEVFEIPGPTIKPDQYVCGQCLTAKDKTA